jgi:zinc/manganese transport system substrate-binding protein
MARVGFAGIAVLVMTAGAAPAKADPVNVVAGENFYGDVARQIGGADLKVTSIMSNPDQDPHLFEASPSTARDLAEAKVVIASGADYDPWIDKLLSANASAGRKEIVVAALVHKTAGDNPHIWYDPATMVVFATTLAQDLAAIDPAHKADYDRGARIFIDSVRPLDARIAEMRKKYAGWPVIASEPVFGYMAQALGLTMRGERFQLAVMNNTEPSASDIAAFENDLKSRKVKVMLYNSQASDPAVQRMLSIARDSGVPIVGITETEPAGKTYQDWMTDQLGALDKALAGSNS